MAFDPVDSCSVTLSSIIIQGKSEGSDGAPGCLSEKIVSTIHNPVFTWVQVS